MSLLRSSGNFSICPWKEIKLIMSIMHFFATESFFVNRNLSVRNVSPLLEHSYNNSKRLHWSTRDLGGRKWINLRNYLTRFSSQSVSVVPAKMHKKSKICIEIILGLPKLTTSCWEEKMDVRRKRRRGGRWKIVSVIWRYQGNCSLPDCGHLFLTIPSVAAFIVLSQKGDRFGIVSPVALFGAHIVVLLVRFVLNKKYIAPQGHRNPARRISERPLFRCGVSDG